MDIRLELKCTKPSCQWNFEMVDGYDGNCDFGFILDSDVVTVDNCTLDHSIDTSNANKDTSVSSGADDKFKSSGEKLKIKGVGNTSVNAELASSDKV